MQFASSLLYYAVECSEKDQNCKLQFPQPDYWPRHSPDFRTVFGIMIGPLICSLSAIGKWFSRFFSFYIGLFLILCTSRFSNFAKGKWSNHDSKNCSEIETVTWSVIWLWKLKFSIFVCLFVYLFVCISRFANSQKENGPIIIPKTVLKSGLWRRSESGCGIFNLKLLYFSQHSNNQALTDNIWDKHDVKNR